LWGRGYFCTTVGPVTEEMIKAYIKNLKPQGEKIYEYPNSKTPENCFFKSGPVVFVRHNISH
jgi:hypothetical protein